MKIDPRAVAFDVDGVVADTMHLFLRIAREEFGVDGFRYEDITCYHLPDCLDMDPAVMDQVIARLIDGSYQAPLRPLPGAGGVLHRLSQVAGPVLLVTARPDPGPIPDWIAQVLKLPAEAVDLIATGAFEAKTDVLLERRIAYFVEDRLETCFLLNKAGITPVVFVQPWNRQPHPFVEVESWRELARLMDFDQD